MDELRITITPSKLANNIENSSQVKRGTQARSRFVSFTVCETVLRVLEPVPHVERTLTETESYLSEQA